MLKSTLRATALFAVALIPPASVAAAHVKGTAPGKYAMAKAPAKSRPAGSGPDQCPQG